jgi:hypothetical protein
MPAMQVCLQVRECLSCNGCMLLQEIASTPTIHPRTCICKMSVVTLPFESVSFCSSA